MNPRKPFPLPVVPAAPAADAALETCSAAEPFALMVLGDSMAPEFVEGDIIIIEPEGLATDGSYVMAWLDDEWIFRQLAKDEQGWKLQPLNPKYPSARIADLSVIKGVIIQKSKPGRRKAAKRYVA
ncbi:MAG: S24 family peptidase [Rhodocyclaceae bacterium]|nr:S24 family peptidase [Rhodocyclaceae bacterium]